MDLVSSNASYWSSTGLSSYSAYHLSYTSSNLTVAYNNKYRGYQVRCVK
jgi:uncharacterized protein (TIGR02145 family)